MLRFQQPLNIALCALGLGLLGFPAPLGAQPSVSSCPDRDAVQRALSALGAGPARGAVAQQNPPLELSTEDLGDTYRVSVNGKIRTYADPRRDCAERAQVAAVFAALVLSSPNAVESEGPAAPAPVPLASVPPAPPPPTVVLPSRVQRWWLDAGATLAMAPGYHGPPLEPGVELGLAYVPRDFGAVLGLRLPATPALLSVGDATAHVLRYPIDLLARWALHAPPFEGAFDAGAVVSLLRMRQAEDGGQSTASRFEPGLRLATRWQLSGTLFSPYVALFSEVIPWRYELALEPTGVLAKTPGWWLGATLGLSAHFD